MKKCIYKGHRFNVYEVKIKNRNGHEIIREVVKPADAAVILPILENGDILFIRNERFAVGKTLWELPAGTLEEDESPEETAKRELIEETGYQCQELRHIHTFYTTPGFCEEKIFAFVAHDLKFVGQQLEETENIRVEKIHWSHVRKMIEDRIIEDGKTLATLLLWFFIFEKSQ